MSGLQLNSITAVGNAAAATVASALAPKKQVVPISSVQSSKTAVKANDATSGTTGTSTSSTASAGNITSNEFLTLLVTELKNQDPTQPTDPNAYITQLAQVNSLQQLIEINTGIGTLDSSITGTAKTTGS